jgi:hypothetical protein
MANQFSPFSHLMSLIERIPDQSPLFGEVDEAGRLRLPKHEDVNDRRKANWPKKIRCITDDILNDPTSINDCWFVPAAATKADGYHEIKFSKNGSKGKFRTARALRVLVEPNHYDTVQDRNEMLQAIHKCGRGKATGQGDPCCVNPHHVYFGTNAVNQDTKGCKYGATFLCPHERKCVYTCPITGKYKSCRSSRVHIEQCRCSINCYLSFVLCFVLLNVTKTKLKVFLKTYTTKN